jgi:uncharacterized protein (PEP-CTERM system associated)
MTMRSAFILASASALLFAPQAQAQKRQVTVTPYLEVSQSFFADLKNGGDVLTYTTLTSGVDASVRTQRTEVQVNYRYDYRFGWNRNQGDQQIHSGIARARFIAVPNLLSLEAGALATRTRVDLRGDASNPLIGNPNNTTQLYSVYAGPTIATNVGEIQIGANYRFGYTKVESRSRSPLLGSQPLLDIFDSSTSHVATASVGMGSGTLPFGWTVSGNYEREDAKQLDQRFERKYARADVVVPVTPTVAVVGGVGYEDIKASQRDALRDVTGTPILDGRGRFQTDPASPRLLAFDSSGFIWDTGVVWRPSRRTSAEFRVGRRYGSMTYTGSVSYQMNASMAFQAGLYDGIQTFGRQLNQSLAALPTQFTVARNPFGNQVGGCVYSVAGGGGCLDSALQSVATGTYRSRGLNAVLSYQRGPMRAGIGGGYAQRKFFAPTGAFFSTNGVKDESYYLQAFVARQLDEVSSVDASVYANLYDSGILGAPNVIGTGATAAYYRRFGSRFTGTAALGLYSSRVEDVASSLTGSALLGAKYEF